MEVEAYLFVLLKKNWILLSELARVGKIKKNSSLFPFAA
jgi:hypothetical protein